MRRRHLIAALVLAGCGGAASADSEPTAPEAQKSAAPVLSCRSGIATDQPTVAAREFIVGPFTLARWQPGDFRDAFDGLGWKLPVGLRADARATLTVPKRHKSEVGLVFTHAAQSRVHRVGVPGADLHVTFKACPRREGMRTGWPGGIVVDRPRCVTLSVSVAGRARAFTLRVPLGKKCG